MTEQPRRELTMEEFKDRAFALWAVENPDAGPLNLPDKAWAYLRHQPPRDIISLTDIIARIEDSIQALPRHRAHLADALYRSGQSDTHPLLHPVPETITAGELCGKHLGLRFRCREYQVPGAPLAAEREFVLDSFRYVQDRLMILTGRCYRVHQDTVLTIVEEPRA